MANARYFQDVLGRKIRLTAERLMHIRTSHPELADPVSYLEQTLRTPDELRRSRTDTTVVLYYRYFAATPVTSKYLCVVVKLRSDDPFIITLYFTDTLKRGQVLWTKP